MKNKKGHREKIEVLASSGWSVFLFKKNEKEFETKSDTDRIPWKLQFDTDFTATLWCSYFILTF